MAQTRVGAQALAVFLSSNSTKPSWVFFAQGNAVPRNIETVTGQPSAQEDPVQRGVLSSLCK